MINPFLGDSIDLFILLFGQSNAVGTTSGDPSRLELIGDIPQSYIYSDAVYQQLNYPDNNNGAAFGCELSLCFDYTNYCRRDVYIEKHARNGSSLAQEVGRQDWNVLSNELIVDAEDAMTRLKAKAAELNCKNPKFVSVWIQGERDARIGTGDEYQANFNAVLDALNAIQPLDLTVMNILNPQIVNSSVDFTEENVQSVRQAQIDLINEHDYVIALDMLNYELGADDLHFTGDAQQQIGTDVFKMIQRYFNI